MDVSQRVAESLDFKGAGTARIKVEYVGRASLKGSDDDKLLATLRIDGGPASLDGGPAEETMLASDAPPDAPEPRPPPRETLAQVQRSPRPETDFAIDAVQDPLPPRRRLASPVPPQRPYDVSVGEGSLLASGRADAPRAFDARAASRPGVRPLVSFAPIETAAKTGPAQSDD